MQRVALLVLIALLAVAIPARPAAAQICAPQLAWEFGNLRGLKMRKGTAVDFVLPYTVTVPPGTAASYSVTVEICTWVPVDGNIPTEVDTCSVLVVVPVAELTEVEAGTVYQGHVRFGYDPSQITFGKTNRFSYTLTLRQIDGPDPEQVIATEEFNDVIFTGGKRSKAAAG